MRKLYFIASIPATAKDNVISGVVANGEGRKATPEETSVIIAELVRRGASQTLVDALRDSSYPGPVSVFERRAAARKEAGVLNSFGGLFNWSVLSVGDSIRKPVTKPLGWRIMVQYSGDEKASVSSYNYPDGADDKRVEVDHAHLFNGDEDANYLFPTRDAARAAMERHDLRTSAGYSLVAVR
ncbi:hypothetical protein [Bacteriophage Titan-X]|uniref:Uncharacterized protein n=1 Tax=Bacteriophage Titan-X TaxID=2662140 RepID=A0A5Q2U9C5_9CAUD|nr:hypothetical protein [Bacteriophage Titan-X]